MELSDICDIVFLFLVDKYISIHVRAIKFCPERSLLWLCINPCLLDSEFVQMCLKEKTIYFLPQFTYILFSDNIDCVLDRELALCFEDVCKLENCVGLDNYIMVISD